MLRVTPFHWSMVLPPGTFSAYGLPLSVNVMYEMLPAELRQSKGVLAALPFGS